MTLQAYLRALRERWKTITAFVVVALVLGTGYVVLTPQVYRAGVQIFVVSTSDATSTSALAGATYAQAQTSTYAAIIANPDVLSRVQAELATPLSPAALAAKISAEAPVGQALVDVYATDGSPGEAAQIANATARAFVEVVQGYSTPSGSQSPSVRLFITDPAVPPGQPQSPDVLLVLAVAAFLGLALGVAAALVRNALDNTVKTPAHAVEATQATTVGAVPFDPDRPKQPVVSFGTGHSASAESYRQVRTNLQFLDVDNPPRVLVVTSAMPGEGKTTTAVNLAHVLAEAGHRVGLVEGDLRRPRVARYLGLVEKVGITDVLAGRAQLEDVVQQTGSERVDVIASGPHPPNPSELLGSTQMRTLLQEMRRRYDYVVVDAPPLLPVTDAAVVSTVADGAIVVARYRRTRREQLARATDNLRAVDARVLGTIMNMVPARSDEYEYYYYESDATTRGGAPDTGPELPDGIESAVRPTDRAAPSAPRQPVVVAHQDADGDGPR